ncbi:alpha/beta fold hydrolase [Desulforamulus ferrireducens]|uniref:alpha/beta fold hydrolase n=1 Tax=Desulforamulus ferrireducens TaxID=1833852 RepID=UPI001A9A5CC7|nr:alpha/beta fold hydrolase [Desulforamulus ferrireducens]
MSGNKRVILIHGFMRDARDMQALQGHLAKLGYEGILVSLSLTFQPLTKSVAMLEGLFAAKFSHLASEEKIHLVGHSTGGLVIRSWLAQTRYGRNIGRCVLVATPNQGSELADLAGRYCPLLPAIFKTLASLQSKQVRKLPAVSHLPVEIGAIAGSKNNLLLGHLLKGENDGRVTVASVRLAGLKDFLVLPLDHLVIHKEPQTARFIDRFLQRGSFS